MVRIKKHFQWQFQYKFILYSYKYHTIYLTLCLFVGLFIFHCSKRSMWSLANMWFGREWILLTFKITSKLSKTAMQIFVKWRCYDSVNTLFSSLQKTCGFCNLLNNKFFSIAASCFLLLIPTHSTAVALRTVICLSVRSWFPMSVKVAIL